MFNNKKASGWVIVIIIILLLLYLTSTKKVMVGNTKVSTATQSSCNLIGQDYDAVNKVCVARGNTNAANAQK